MKYLIILLLGLTFITACEPEQKEEIKEESVLDNLPISDRDLLLAPLESAYNDLKDIAENDPSLQSVSQEFDSAGVLISESYKLNEGDTVAKYQVTEQRTRVEKRSWYWDDKGNMYHATARIKSMDEAGNVLEVRAYQFYFEDNGALLSGYGKTSYNGEKLPSVWTPVCLTTEEEAYLLR